MNDFDEKTQRWLLRTQEIRRVPALRGGPPPDPRARRHTALSLAAAALVLLFLLILPRVRPVVARPEKPLAPVAVERVAIEPPPIVAVAPPGVLPWQAAFVPPVLPPPTRAVRSGWTPPAGGSPLTPPGHVPPPAPVWLDGARDAGAAPFVAGVFLPSAPPPTHPRADLLGR